MTHVESRRTTVVRSTDYDQGARPHHSPLWLATWFAAVLLAAFTCFWTYTMLMYMTICTLILWFLRVKRILDWNARTKMWRGPVIFGSIPLSKPTDIYNFTEQQSSLVS